MIKRIPKYALLCVATLCILFSSCADKSQGLELPMFDPDIDAEIAYLALGDSYTIGQGVATTERWPVQLADSLRVLGWDVVDGPRIIATTGWTTDDLLQALDNSELPDTFDLVSLLIGVNDQFRNRPIADYPIKFSNLLARAIAYAQQDTQRVFVLSIPDYGVTPFGSSRNPARIAQELDQYNGLADSVCQSYGVSFYTITDISRLAEDDPALIAGDGLHPSGEMYTAWVERILPSVIDKFK